MVNLAFCGLTWLSSLTKFELLPFWHSFSSSYKIYVIGILESLVFEEPLLLLVFCLVFCFCFGLLLLLLSLLGAFFFVSKEYHTFLLFASWVMEYFLSDENSATFKEGSSSFLPNS